MNANYEKNQLVRKYSKPFIFSLIIFIVLITSTIGTLQPWRKISHVDVSSMELSQQKIEKYAQISVGTPYWKILGQTAFLSNKILKADDKIDSVTIKHQGNTVLINVIEKVTSGYVNKNNKWYVMDRNANLKAINFPKGDAPVYSGFKTNQSLQIVAKQFSSQELTLRQNVSQIIFSPTKDNASRIVAVMNDGNTIYASIDTFGKKVSYYPGIAAQMPNKGIVDLQFGAYSYAYGADKPDKSNLKK